MNAFRLGALVLLVSLAGCSGNGPDAPSSDAATDAISDAGGSDANRIPGGILLRDPESSRLRAVQDDAPAIELHPGGFDIVGHLLAHGDNDRSIMLHDEDGTERTVRTAVHQVARASLDPTGRFAVVQATAEPVGPTTPLPPDLNIYRIDLADGTSTRIGSDPEPEEGPEWSPDGRLIAYSSFSPVRGIDLHVVDAGTLEEVALFEDAGGLHLSFSRDGRMILEAGRLRVLDAGTGELLHDLRDAARTGVADAGYEIEDRYPGQANRGPFPLDGDFSPDGTRVVFDGAVKMGAGSGVVVATMRLDGSGFEVVAGPFEVEPGTTNGLNYSEVNPMWV